MERPAALVLLALLLAAPAAAQRVVYVRPGAAGANNGTSWANAYRELRQALTASVPPVQIWVATGTYKPTNGTDRAATFQLRNGVALYGGFDGTETTREERDWEANVTTLSGEIGSPTSITDNSYHVVSGSGVDSTAVLDGFTVTGGTANGTGGVSDPLRRGGGMYNAAGSPTVRHVTFRGNGASFAGSGVANGAGSEGRFDHVLFDGDAMFNEQSSPRVTDAVFEGNVSVGSGGAMLNVGSSPHLESVVFRNNTANRGGAMANVGGSHPVCLDCVFEGNAAPVEDGGAVYNTTSAPLFVNARFEGNTSRNCGGAIWNTEVGSDMACVGCLFRANRSDNGAGGAACVRLSNPTFVNTLFEGNVSAIRGAGAVIADINASPLFANVAFVGNQAPEGGAVIIVSGAPRFVGATFAGNRATTQGAALLLQGGTATVLNGVVWGNALTSGAPSGVTLAGGSLVMRHGVLQGGCTPPMICEAVQDADPLYVRAPVWSGTTLVDAGDLRLRAGSPAIDAGDVAHLPADLWDLDGDGDTEEPLPLDILGEPRVQGAGVDPGAYEGGVTVAAESGPEVEGVALSVAPNPARGAATATLTLSGPARVRLALYDVLGREVARLHDGPLAAGMHRLAADLRQLPPGLYVLRADIGAITRTARLVVAR